MKDSRVSSIKHVPHRRLMVKCKGGKSIISKLSGEQKAFLPRSFILILVLMNNLKQEVRTLQNFIQQSIHSQRLTGQS